MFAARQIGEEIAEAVKGLAYEDLNHTRREAVADSFERSLCE